jgi:ATP-binding cassette subfamily B protein
VPLFVFVSWSQGLLALEIGALLKTRLLAGALRLSPDEVRRRGTGQLLGQVLESQAVESLALGAGALGVMAVLELGIAAVVLSFGAASRVELLLLAGWCALTVGATLRYFGRRGGWTAERITMTHDLVERMLGHRTRLAQQPRARWHDGEDGALERYLRASRAMDADGVRLTALLPRGWLVVGLLGLSGAFILGGQSPERLAIALGGTLLAQRALHKLVLGLSSFAGAAVAWREVAALFHAAARPQLATPPDLVVNREPLAPARPIIEVSEVLFRYAARGEPVLRGVSLDIHPGDRVLLEGPSGGGKSTLAGLLAGQHEPESGLLLLGGLDRRTVGHDGWRRHIAKAPQYHDNHVLSASFAFNLLMGRAWPPTPSDMQHASAVCEELGLGALIGRMPAGLEQMVGETGWQLSHGERSRLFIARALLQGADLMVLDESFAALDPETLQQALECVLRRANALLVIAHP